MKKIKEIKKPFFSKLLEEQRVEDTKYLKGGKRWEETMKYPSDGDEI